MKKNLTDYDVYPDDMLAYLRMYGPHFNRKLAEYAVKKMTKMVDNKEVNIVPETKEQVEKLLRDNNVRVVNNVLWDEVYVAGMCEADFLGESVPTDKHKALYIRNVIDDVDAPDGIVFNRFYADCCYSGIAIPWEDVL